VLRQSQYPHRCEQIKHSSFKTNFINAFTLDVQQKSRHARCTLRRWPHLTPASRYGTNTEEPVMMREVTPDEQNSFHHNNDKEAEAGRLQRQRNRLQT